MNELQDNNYHYLLTSCCICTCVYVLLPSCLVWVLGDIQTFSQLCVSQCGVLFFIIIANHFFSHSLFSATPTVVGYSWEAYFVTSCALATAFNRLTFYGCYKDCTSGTVDKDLHHVSGTCPVVMSIVSCSLHSHIVPLSCDGSVSSVLE